MSMSGSEKVCVATCSADNNGLIPKESFLEMEQNLKILSQSKCNCLLDLPLNSTFSCNQ